eukprot:1179107-Prorocentrum_minimum.AAC.6
MAQVCSAPRMIVIRNFLSTLECGMLRDLAEPDLRRSRVTNGRVIENRTSYSTFLTGEKEKAREVLAIEDKIRLLVEKTPLIRAQMLNCSNSLLSSAGDHSLTRPATQSMLPPATVLPNSSPFKLSGTTSESIIESTSTTRRAQLSSNELQR